MADNIVFDTSDLQRGLRKLDISFKNATRKAIQDIANEVLRLSQMEVPHDTGFLQSTGHKEDTGTDEEPEAIVGYNTVYAARLHENPQYNFQGGRKGKYLEDPIKNNLSVFQHYMNGDLANALR